MSTIFPDNIVSIEIPGRKTQRSHITLNFGLKDKYVFVGKDWRGIQMGKHL